MTDRGRDSLELQDEDRLPWLEPAEDEEVEEIHVGRVVTVVLLGLLLLGAVIGGIYWWQSRDAALEGDGELIAAPEGDYKVRPDEPGGMEVEGKGDATFAASEGQEPGAKLDIGAVPEAPIVPQPQPKAAEPASPAPKAAKQATTTVPESGGALVAKTPQRVPSRTGAEAGAGTVIQLGAFDSEALANSAWKRASERFAFLEGLEHVVLRATVGGRTYYRLRVETGSNAAAKEVCGKLKVAGGDCLIVAQ